MNNIAILIVIAACALVLAWNFIPSFRERMRGWSTIVESTLGVILYYFGLFSDALTEAQQSGYIPENWVQYVPFVLLAWIVLKRFQTTTPLGDGGQ